MKYGILLAFIVVALAQWIIPVNMIRGGEEVLAKGEAWKFETEPVDPSNPFKGKYVVLNFKQNSFTDRIKRHLEYGQEIFVILNKDKNGFAGIESISTTQPSSITNYVKATVSYLNQNNDSTTVNINYPFEEFYMDEYKAPKAETAYREANRDTSIITYARVKIWKGEAVTEDVIIDGKSIWETISR